MKVGGNAEVDGNRSQLGRDAASVDVAEVLRHERAALRSDDNEEPFTALCISGGGVRSATFGLGVLQGLAARGLLSQFDYLSTVSGGGFIGSFLTAWVKRTSMAQACARLGASSAAEAPAKQDPIQHLREYSSYLSPATGALSADVWTLFAGALRNIFLNWLVLIPTLLAVLLVPRFYLSLLSFPERFKDGIMFSSEASYGERTLDAISDSPYVSFGLPLLSIVLFAAGLFSTLRYLPGVGARQHTRKEYNRAILAPLFGAVLAVLTHDSLFYVGRHYIPNGESHIWNVVIWTTVACSMAWVAFIVVNLKKREKKRTVSLWGPLPAAIFAMAVGTGCATWTIVNLLLPQVSWSTYVTLGPPAILIGYSLATMIFTGLSSEALKDEDREWLSRSSAGVLLACVGWIGVAGAVTVLPLWALSWPKWSASVIGVGGALSALLSRIPVGDTRNANSEDESEAKPLPLTLAVKLAPLVFVTLLAITLSLLTNVLLVGLRNLSLVLNIYAYGRTRRPKPARIPEHAFWTQVETLLTQGQTWLSRSLRHALRPISSRFVEVTDLVGHPSVEKARIDVLGEHFPHPRVLLGVTDHEGLLSGTNLSALAILAVVFVGLAWVMARYININTFSLHGMYRDRLVRAYLGATNPQRKPNPFTDFDDRDDAPLCAFRGVRPLHIVNTTLNLVSSDRLAWQERKAASFTMTPLHCGSAEVGYRDSAEYGAGISLGTAVAISGAAASPNMGYYSTPLVGFIMTLFNARLGSWLGNPGPAGEKSWKESGPRSALGGLIAEASGATSAGSEYVYLSDGGHFENLGLYEIVRRRCRTVLVVDSGCDRMFALSDLGNALRKIRIDFGVPIEFCEGQLQALSERQSRHAVAVIRYSAADPTTSDGLLIYLKPTLLGTEPPDVSSYARSHAGFPHQSTADQSFDESQTESYRELGATAVRDLCANWPGSSLSELAEHLRDGGGLEERPRAYPSGVHKASA